MAIAVLVEGAGFSQSLYDKVANEVMPGGRLPAGCLFHMGGPTENGGWRVVDMWESQEAFERFSRETLGPAMAKAGYTQRPDVKFWPVHNTRHALT